MSRVLVLSLFFLGLSACADNILKERPVRAASSRESGASMSVSSKSQASICRAYRRQLHLVQVAQVMKQLRVHQRELRAKELSLNAVIADVCE